ncbi:TonB-dependent receptor, partial [bacterium]|nr:TonB-dependent receptor [bacterium]
YYISGLDTRKGEKMLKKISLVFISMFVLVRAGLTVDYPGDLGTIVVTATKSEELLREIPVTAIVITGEEIEKSQAKNMNEILENIPGVSLSGGDADGRNPVINLRGFYDYNSSYVLVLVDGMSINSPDTGKPYIDSIPLNNIERIEVIKGGHSAVWGSYAMGGVINIITKQGKETAAAANLSIGEWGTKNTDISGQALLPGNIAFSISANSKISDGWRQYSGYDIQTMGGSLSKRNDALGYKSRLSFGYYEDDYKSPGYLSEKQWRDGQLHMGDATYWCAGGRQNNEYAKFMIEQKLPLNLSARLDLNYFRKGYTFYYRSSGGTADINDVYVFTGGIEFGGKILKNSFTLGFNVDKGNVDSRNYAADADNEEIDKDVLKKHMDTDISKFALYLQDMWNITDRMNLNIGARYDKLKHDITDRVAVKEYHPDVSAVSPNLGLLFKVTSKLNVFGSVSQAFRLPTESQFCKNSDLNPEKALNYEIGAKFFLDRISCELSGYQMNVIDKITYEETSPAVWEYRNVGEVKNRGIELASKISINKELSIALSGDIMQTEILKEPKYPDRVGKNLTQSPLWKTSLGLHYESETGFGAGADLRKVGSWYMDDKNTEKYSGYFVTDLNFAWKRDKLGYFLKVDNIFDEKYCRKAYISGTSKLYYPSLPRTFSAGINVKF